MKPKVLIVEDQILIANAIAAELNENQYEVIAICDTGEETLKYLQFELPDIIIMDIALNGHLDGIETSKKINQKYRIPIIYLTDLKEKQHFNRAKETFPKNYLTKPFQPPQLLMALELALNKSSLHRHLEFTEKFGFFQTSKEGAVKVAFEEIKYLMADGQYCNIVLKDDSVLKTSYPMKEVFKKIPYQDIIRVNRSACVNLNEVDAIEGNQIRIGKLAIKIGETYRDEVKALFNVF